jgi:hypothetical protein
MAAPEDIAGMRYGRLTAIRRVQRVGKTGRRRSCWQFRCNCGATTVQERHDVRIGVVKSCGCLRREVTAARWQVLREAKAKAATA